MNAIVLVDGDRSNLVMRVGWHHKCILSWILLISLSRSGTIAEDPVEMDACTIFIVGLKPNEVDSLSHVFL